MPTTTVEIGLNKQDAGDQDWDGPLNAGIDEANTRLTLNGTTDPNGVIVGRWKGQKYFDTLRIAWWVFNGTLGANTGWVREIGQGFIWMWSGAIGAIPDGWVLADGVLDVATGYTPPDLSGKFIAGYDAADLTDYDMDVEGGEKEHTLVTSEVPSHNHGSSGGHSHTVTQNGGSPGSPTGSLRYGNSGGSSLAVTGSGAHTHTSVGGGGAHENRPQYYTLAFLAKL